MRLKFASGIILSLIACHLLIAFMSEVPFSSDVSKVTKKFCEDNLERSLLGNPKAGKVLWWRDETENIRSTHFVVDEGWNRIVYTRIDSDDERIDTIKAYGGFGQGPGQFNMPVAIDVDKSGRIFVADRGNKRVVQLQYNFNTNSISFLINIPTAGTHYFYGPLSLNARDVYIDDNGTSFNYNDDYLWVVSPLIFLN